MANMAGRGPATQGGPGTTATKTGRGMGRGFASHDLPIIGFGLLGLISSFLPWYGTRYRGFTYGNYGYGTVRTWTGSLNAWHSGALAWVPILLMLAAAALAAAAMLGRGRIPGVHSVGPSTVIAALSALAALLIIVRWISLPHLNANYGGYASVSTGARAGLILGLICSLAMTLLALRRLKSSGELGHGHGHGQDGYERDASMAGYSGRGADRARVIDRDREYAGHDSQRQDVTGRTGTPSERSTADNRGYDSESRGGLTSDNRGATGPDNRGPLGPADSRGGDAGAQTRGGTGPQIHGGAAPERGAEFGPENSGDYGRESGYDAGSNPRPEAGERDRGREQRWDR